MRLFIAEKPSAAKAIADVFQQSKRMSGYYDCGDTYVSYAVGHLFEQQSPDHYLSDDIPRTKKGGKVWRLEDLPIIPSEWAYRIKPRTKDQLSVLGQLIRRADEVVNAGDMDREGQAIVDHILSHFKCRVPVKRFCVSAQDEVSIRRGLNDLRDNDEYKGWCDAAVARQRADWLVGMNLSRAFTLEAQAKGSRDLLVVGRVQSPCLALVVARDRSIESFTPKPYYTVSASVVCDTQSFSALWEPSEGRSYLDAESRVIDYAVSKNVASELNGCKQVNVLGNKKEPKKKLHPLGLSLTELTLLTSNRFSYSAEQTLNAAQSLYEKHKLLSYPRTDCRYIPESQHTDAKNILEAISHNRQDLKNYCQQANSENRSRIFDSTKITAHHCIVPTMHKGCGSVMTEIENRVYEIVARNYIAQFFPIHCYDQTTIELEATPTNNQYGPYTLKTKGIVITSNGWKAVFKDTKSVESETQPLPYDLQNKQIINIADAFVDEKSTRAPNRFTEGTLIKALEQIHKYVENDQYRALLKSEDGIGTSATRAGVIGELKRRDYLKVDGKHLVSSDLGRRLIDSLPESVTSPVLTARYERELHEIQDSGGALSVFVDKQIAFVKHQLSVASDHVSVEKPQKGESDITDVPCPICGMRLVRRKNSSKKTGFWWGCSAHPSCKITFPDKRGKPDYKHVRTEAENTKHECPKCNSALLLRVSQKGIRWYGCSSFPKCKNRYFEKNGEPDIK